MSKTVCLEEPVSARPTCGAVRINALMRDDWVVQSWPTQWEPHREKGFHISPIHEELEKPSQLWASSWACKFWCNAKKWSFLGTFLNAINHDSPSATLRLLWVKFDSPAECCFWPKKSHYYSRNENLLVVGMCASLKTPSLKLRAWVMKTFVSLIPSEPQSEH